MLAKTTVAPKAGQLNGQTLHLRKKELVNSKNDVL